MARMERVPRKDVFMYPPETLVLVTDKEHPLYDPRVEDPADENMIANVAMHGVIEPILARRNGAEIEVIAGRGRIKAAREANKRLVAEGKVQIQVPVMFKSGADADLFSILITENEIRREDSILRKGEKARKLLNMGYAEQQIATTFGVTRQAVESWLTMEQMPEPIKEAVRSGEVSATAALQLARHSRGEQIKRLEDMRERGVKPTTHNVRSAAASPENKPAPRMRSRREIEREEKEHPIDTAYNEGYVAALRWVLEAGNNE